MNHLQCGVGAPESPLITGRGTLPQQNCMSEIYFIRHGQASFGQENYDRLSSIGALQAQVLARHLAKTGKRFDALYHGEMQRQQKTAWELIRHCSTNGLAVPAPVVHAGFNEYDSFAVWHALLPELLEDDPALEKDLEEIPANQKAFQKIFSRLMARWAAGAYRATQIERWEDFIHRVRQAIDELTAAHGGGKRLAVFTSGGPIAVAVRLALGLSDKATLEISWQLMNASITRLKYNRHGIMLAGFNEVAHLELQADERLLTYR